MKEIKNKFSIARILIIITLIAVAIAALFLPVQKADAAEKEYNYNFVYYYFYNGEMRKIEATYSSDRQCILFKSHGGAGTRGMRMTASSGVDNLRMYRLNDSGTFYEQVFPIVTSYSVYKDGEFISDTSYVSGSKTMLDFAPGFILSQGYLDLCNSNIKILACNSGNRNSDSIIYQYLSTGRVSSEYKDDVYVLSGTSLFTKYFTSGTQAFSTDANLKIINAEIDDNGLITYTPPIIPDDALESGISIIIPTKKTYSYIFDYPLRLGSAIQTHFNNQGLPNVSPIASIILQPYYVGSDGYVHIGQPCTIGINWNSNYYNKEDNNERLFTITTKSLKPELVDPNGDEEFSHGGGGRRENGDTYVMGKSEIISGEKREVVKTEERNDFYLKDVKVSSGIGNFTKTIKWSGTSIDGTLASIPSSDSTVIITYAMYDEDMNLKMYKLDTVNISKGKYTLNYNDFINEIYASPYTWDGEIRLCPVYYLESNKHLYMGRQSVVDLLHGGISEEYEDDEGNFKQDTIRKDNEDSSGVGDTSTSDSGDGIWGSISDFVNSIGSLNGFVGVFFGLLQDLIGMMGVFPSMLANVIGFIPSIYLDSIGVFLLVILFLRLLGR